MKYFYFVVIAFSLSCTSKTTLQKKYSEISDQITVSQQKIKDLNFLYQNAKQKGDSVNALHLRKEIFVKHKQVNILIEHQKEILRKINN